LKTDFTSKEQQHVVGHLSLPHASIAIILFLTPIPANARPCNHPNRAFQFTAPHIPPYQKAFVAIPAKVHTAGTKRKMLH
jgi:hypothetical protein